MSKIIHVVQGSLGEYSDRTEWLVKAFTDKNKGEAYILKCEEAGRLLKLAQEDGMVDHKVQYDYTGVSYYVEEVELEIE